MMDNDLQIHEYMNKIEAENAALKQQRDDLLAACETFVEWLDREDAGFVKAGNKRETPEDEKRWREWYDGNLALCSLAQEQARAAIAKVKQP